MRNRDISWVSHPACIENRSVPDRPGRELCPAHKISRLCDSLRSKEEPMAKFRIQPHVRLQEWVGEENGFFAEEAARVSLD